LVVTVLPHKLIAGYNEFLVSETPSFHEYWIHILRATALKSIEKHFCCDKPHQFYAREVKCWLLLTPSSTYRYEIYHSFNLLHDDSLVEKSA
jgi:hypothetical protein